MHEGFPHTSDINEYSSNELGNILLNMAVDIDDEMTSHMLIMASDRLRVDTQNSDVSDEDKLLLNDEEMKRNLSIALHLAADRQKSELESILIQLAADRLTVNLVQK